MTDEWPDAIVVMGHALLAGDADVYKLPHVLPEDPSVRLLRGDPGREGGAAIRVVGEIVRRCAPWVVCHLAPRVEVDGRLFRGVCLRGSRVIAVAVDDGVRSAARVAHHEIWHAVEDELDPSCIARVQALTKRGREWPGEYLSSPVERRARIYEAYASLRDEGWSPTCVEGTPFFEADPVLEDVYSGRFAAVVAASDAPRPPPRPGVLTRLRQAALARRQPAAQRTS